MRQVCLKILAILVFGLFFTNVQAGDYFKSDRFILDFYSPQWVNTPGGVSTDPSFSFAFSFGKDIPYKKSNFSCFYGLGYDFTNINHNANLKSLSVFEGTPREIGMRVLNVPYNLNRLSTQYLELPIEFRYRTQTKNPFRLYLGGKFGYMTKSKYTLDKVIGDRHERKGLNELERFKYGITMRIGYGLVNFYTYYGLNGLIVPEKQKGVNQLSFGISFIAN
tara:strand:- start:99 stop:761 length:663 start_codon:yes stop_codon:yes gene_type:complete